MDFDALPIGLQLLASAVVALIAVLAGRRGYQNSAPPASDLHIAGALVSAQDLKPLVEAMTRLAVALERRALQWEERAEQERAEAIERRHQDEIAELRKTIARLERERRA